MATVQIRDIPEDVYETIRKRARAAGQSIQAYMREQVIELANQRTKEEIMTVIESTLAKRTTGGPTRESIMAELRELRGA
ncbi:antitoxin [Actinosynnema sp. ALI-1.44]|uniref:FitA-like ribbon-helix-helix domain-containing protein n=1 Tax=Actinosynnema sp. ALI-1.44 TaxID=1933779 RepID=UPI00097CA7CC|nr:antitoxin [Actinosynnema sp. ALI-1.44]ONI70490.1 antitoxin [Actinosynnema sp. ALI-1.44]